MATSTASFTAGPLLPKTVRVKDATHCRGERVRSLCIQNFRIPMAGNGLSKGWGVTAITPPLLKFNTAEVHGRRLWSRTRHLQNLSPFSYSADAGAAGGSGSSYGGGDEGRGGGDGGKGDEPEGQGSGSHKPGDSRGLVASYLALLERHPVPTKSVTCGLLNIFADLFCQVVLEKVKEIDLKRAAVLAAIGFFMVAPCLHYWYFGLSKLITFSGTKGALAQLFVDQFIFSPISIATFFVVLLTLEGRPQEIRNKLNQDWGPTVVANWKLWVPFQFINFRLVPQSLQVAMANLVGVAWTVYLSYASHNAVAK